MAALKATDSDWAREQLAILATKSPQTLKVAFRQLRLGAQARSFTAHMAMEYRIGARVVQRHDFLEKCVQSGIWDRQIMGYPNEKQPHVLFVNEALLKEAGSEVVAPNSRRE